MKQDHGFAVLIAPRRDPSSAQALNRCVIRVIDNAKDRYSKLDRITTEIEDED